MKYLRKLEKLKQTYIYYKNLRGIPVKRILATITQYKQDEKENNLQTVNTQANSMQVIDQNEKIKKKQKIKESTLDSKDQQEKIQNIKCLDQIGGIDMYLNQINEYIILPIQQKEMFKQINIQPPRGVLIHGQSGTGKTTLGQAICKQIVQNNENFCYFYKSCTEIVGALSGQSEKNLRVLFQQAIKEAPSIIFLDELGSIAGQKNSQSKEMEKRIVSELKTQIKNLENIEESVFIIGATSDIDKLDSSIRIAGIFDSEILLQIPDESQRLNILQKLIEGVKHSITEEQVQQIAKHTSGYVPADLSSLVRKTGVITVKQFQNNQLSELIVQLSHFLEAIKSIIPSLKKEGFNTIPSTSFDDIGALGDLKQTLHENIILPITQKHKFVNFDFPLKAGVLLYGPPGCGKTLLAKAVAHECESNFISVKGPELINKYVGESEKSVREVFKKARECKPCVIFFDEFDALCPKRGSDSNQVTERIVNQFLSELDGVEDRTGVFVIAATNRYDIIDKAIIRSNRLEQHLFVPLPNAEDRISILKTCLKKSKIEENFDYVKIMNHTNCQKYSGADIQSLVNQAKLIKILEMQSKDDESTLIEERHFMKALEKKALQSQQKKEFSKN